MTTRSKREIIAQVQHEIWSHWMQYLFSVCVENRDGSYTIPTIKVKRWKRQLSLSYDELSNIEKESDRNQSDKVLSALKGAIQQRSEALESLTQE